MTLSEAVREPVAIYAFVITYLILYRLSHPDKSLSAPEMGGTASAPPPATPSLESNGMELSLVNFHPESINKGISWTGLCVGLAVLALIVFKVWPLTQNWIDERRHAAQLRMHRHEIMLDFAWNSIPMSNIRRQPAARHTSLTAVQPSLPEFRAQPNTQSVHPEFRGQEKTPFAPPLKDCQCQSCSDC